MRKEIDFGLSDELTFDSYVSGRANQLAIVAALNVSETPGETYNPLYIFGGAGLGKTHLLHAIGNRHKEHFPSARVCYIHAEKYRNGLIKLFEEKDFNEYLHSLDLLLLDDIHLLSNENQTKEYFFDLVTSLINANKQVIITTDKHPKKLPSEIEKRLQTRVSEGLTVELKSPNLEMRLAILIKKAELVQVNLDEEVAYFIAKHVRSNVKGLEMTLNKMAVISKLTTSDIDMVLARKVLM